MIVSHEISAPCIDKTHFLLTKVVRKVGNHDLVLGGNAVFRWTTLFWLAGSTGFAVSWCFSTLGDVLSIGSLGGSISKWEGLAFGIGCAFGFFLPLSQD